MLYQEFKEKVCYYANKKEKGKNNTCSISYTEYKDKIEPRYMKDTSVSCASDFCKKYCMYFVD